MFGSESTVDSDYAAYCGPDVCQFCDSEITGPHDMEECEAMNTEPCEVCEERAATTRAKFVDANICQSCAASEPVPPCSNCNEEAETLHGRGYCPACAKEDIIHGQETAHEQDEDCTLDENAECIMCHVWHGDPCVSCGGRGFHRTECGEMQ